MEVCTMNSTVEAQEESTAKSELRKCEVCDENSAKYCCPKCGIRSCSLPCVNYHKEVAYCDGIRDRTAYVPLTAFNGLNLLSDYRFLEETARCVDNAMRYPMKRPKYYETLSMKIPFWQYRMVVECRKRGMELMIMPQHFQRRKTNTTYFNPRTKEMGWRMEWIFPQADIKFTDEKISEDKTLGEALEPYLSPDLCDPIVKQQLCFYQSAGFGEIAPLMKVERIQSNEPKFFELDFSETIRSNLVGKIIYEFPTIYLVLKHHIQSYDILEATTEKPVRELEEGEIETTEDECEAPDVDEIHRHPVQQMLGPYFYQVESENNSSDTS